MYRPNTFTPPIAEQMATELGYIVVQWSEIENILSGVIMAMSDLNYALGVAMTAEMSMVQKLNLISVLVNLSKNETWISEWLVRIKQIDDARIRRNELLHSVWSHSVFDNKHVIFKTSARTEVRTKLKKVLLEEAISFKETLYFIIKGLDYSCRVTVSHTGPIKNASLPIDTQNPIEPNQSPIRKPSPMHTKMEAEREAKRAKRKAHHERSAQMKKGESPTI